MNKEIASVEADFNNQVKNYIEVLTAVHKERFERLYKNLTPPTFVLEPGQKYIRVVRVDTQRSVQCFIDKRNGDLLKAETWKKPAKDARGNIFNEKRPYELGDFYKQ